MKYLIIAAIIIGSFWVSCLCEFDDGCSCQVCVCDE
jgi:hypothetical protein